MSEEIQKELIQKVFSKFHSESFIYNVLSSLRDDSQRQKLIQYLDDNDVLSKTDVEIQMMRIKGLTSY